MFTAVALSAGIALAAPRAEAEYCGAWAPAGWVQFTCLLHPNAQNHFIHVSISSYVIGDLWDVHHDVIVYHGAAGIWGIEKTVTGLVDVYYGAVKASTVPGQITISND